MLKTWANTDRAKTLLNWTSQVNLEDGIDKTIRWHIQEEDFLKHINY